MKKIDFLIILFLIIISVVTLKDLFKPGLFTSHDGIHQVVRLYYFDQVIRDGQIPPRWVDGLLNGFGYPLFIFSYHLPWLIAEPFLISGFSIFDSIKITFLLGFILSGITMYFFQKEIFGRLAAFTAMMIYLFAPNRFLNIFVRAAIGDATSYIFPPLLFLSLYKLKNEKKVRSIFLILGAISLTGILLSHAFVFFFFALVVALYFFYSLLFIKKKKRFISRFIILVILTLGLSGYYFFPSLLERNNTKFYEIMSSVFSGNTLLKLSDLLYSPWGYGTLFAKEGAMSLQLGIAQWLVVIVSLVILLFLPNREAIFYLLVFFISIFLMLEQSLPIWKIINKYILIDFPWRIFPLTIFSVAMLAGFVIKKIKYSFLLAILFIFLALYGNRNHLRINQSLDWPLSFYLLLEKTTNSYDEYTPRWVKSDLIEKKKPRIEFSDSRAQFRLIKEKSNYYEVSYKTNEEGLMRINTIYYPGWEVFVNGEKKDIKYSEGFIDVTLAASSGKIVAKFKETDLRLFSDLLTLSSIGVIIFILLRYSFL